MDRWIMPKRVQTELVSIILMKKIKTYSTSSISSIWWKLWIVQRTWWRKHVADKWPDQWLVRRNQAESWHTWHKYCWKRGSVHNCTYIVNRIVNIFSSSCMPSQHKWVVVLQNVQTKWVISFVAIHLGKDNIRCIIKLNTIFLAASAPEMRSTKLAEHVQRAIRIV